MRAAISTSVRKRVSPPKILRACACGDTAHKCDACLARSALPAHVDATVAPAAQAQVAEVLSSPGTPLDGRVRASMESRFGFDFNKVRVHTDARAAASADVLGASAYTVGHHVAFSRGRYAPETATGTRLLAHELAHVQQQDGASIANVARQLAIGEQDSLLEREADAAASAVMRGESSRIGERATGVQLQKHRNDLVAYSGGQRGTVAAFEAGKLVFRGPAVSGHPGHTEWELNVGPIPSGKYTIHPGITRPPVARSGKGVCGAAAIESGYQQITSTDPTPCAAGSAHYCNVPCPTAADPAQLCWTPRDCWGPERIRIEGDPDVAIPRGGTVHRSGFFLHGGNPADPVSSGCLKSLDSNVFAVVRRLKGIAGAVPFCVATGCPQWVTDALTRATVQDVVNTLEQLGESLRGIVPSALD